ncbi:MAG: glycosyltransferase [Lewinellaceae bacterium]|nr:glycosyltransferase [Saprospiraceae bacterium]MCB9338364.1 glycosyltransferase [Lewinellaceae bacterium]
MKISIITVSYNSAKTIEDTINCVLNQSHNDIEYIVVDGASKDGTPQIIKKYQDKITKIIVEPDYGIYDAMNKGIRSATGDVIGFLNADDNYVSNKVLERVNEAFEKNSADSVYGDLCYVADEDTNKVIRFWRAGQFNERSFLNGWMPPHPTFFVRRSVLEKYGVFDPTFRFAGDYELILRLLYKHHISTYYLPYCLVKMRIGGAGNRWVENRLIANLEDRLAWKKNNLKPRPYTTFLKPLRKVFQFVKLHPKAAFLS